MSELLHYQSFGSASPVMILHGLFGSSRNWQSMARRLADQFRVITVDLRNHGRSFTASSMTYPEMAMDILALIDHLGVSEISLIGHSMGGKVAMETALYSGDRIKRLAILDIAPVSYSHRYGKLFDAMRRMPLEDITSRLEAEAWLDDQLKDIHLTRFLLQNIARVEKGFAWRINLDILEDNMDNLSSFPSIDIGVRYAGSTLFLGGEDSHFLQADYHDFILQHFPVAKIRLLPGAGHLLHLERAVEVESILRDFLSDGSISD